MNHPSSSELLVDVQGVDYTAVLTSDPRAGGYTIEIRELPGVFTEADSLDEAVAMVRDVIELYLAESS